MLAKQEKMPHQHSFNLKQKTILAHKLHILHIYFMLRSLKYTKCLLQLHPINFSIILFIISF